MSLAFKVVLTIMIMTFLILITVSILQVHRNLMNKRVFLYVFIPLLPLPLFIALTYIVWPEHILHWAVRLLIAVAVDALALANLYFFSVPFYKAMIPEFKENFFEKDKKNRK